MSNKRWQFLILLLFLVQATIFSQSNTTFEFLRNDASARAAALGGNFITVSDDPNSIFYNPADLATLSTRRLSVGFFKHLLDVNAGYASFGTEIPNFGFVGAGLEYVNYGEFKKTGEEGQNIGTFNAGEFAFIASYAGELLPTLNYGASVKFIYSSIANVSSSSAALDFGLRYLAMPERIIVGASLLNLGTQFDPYVTTRERLPLDLKIGASIYPEHLPAVLLVELHKLNESQDKFFDRFKQFSIGVEFTASPNVQLRIGYNNEQRQEWKIGNSAGLAGFSLGGGFTSDIYSIDYAYTSMGKIGSVHRINVGFKF
jgi:hypothetical protein